MADKIKISVLEDGSIKIETDKVSMPNHTNAENFLKEMFKLAGGNLAKKAKHAFAHVSGKTHQHQ